MMSADWADMILYNAEIHPMTAESFIGWVKVSGGKITDMGKGTPPDTESGIDCRGGRLYPGFIDIHTHIGFIGDGQGEESDDCNEGSGAVSCGIRAIDGINYYDGYFSDAVRGGVTSVITGVGSMNAIGGSMIAVKTDVRTKSGTRSLEKAFIKTAAIKFALGENPKMSYTERDEAPQTRMATAALIRETLYKAEQYMRQKDEAESASDEPEFDIKYEALIPLLQKKIQPHIHCHRADDIMTALRICEEFGFSPLLVHCSEGYLIADMIAEKLAKLGGGAAAGPVICDRGKPEMAQAHPKNAGVLTDAGIKTAICTDHPEVQIDYLTMSAALCVKNGMSREDALRAITINAAELAGISDRTGSIELSKDADLVLFDGDPLDIMSKVKMTIINGEIVYRDL